MKIEIFNETEYDISNDLKLQLKTYMREVTKILEQPTNFEICLNFVKQDEIKRLNKEMRNKDSVTDVLSFPALDIKPGEKLDLPKFEFEKNIETKSFYLGDMAICCDVAQSQAQEFDETFEEEVCRLFVHSLLHLFGYDHIEDLDFAVMNKFEKLVLKDKYKD